MRLECRCIYEEGHYLISAEESEAATANVTHGGREEPVPLRRLRVCRASTPLAGAAVSRDKHPQAAPYSPITGQSRRARHRGCAFPALLAELSPDQHRSARKFEAAARHLTAGRALKQRFERLR